MFIQGLWGTRRPPPREGPLPPGRTVAESPTLTLNAYIQKIITMKLVSL